MELPAELKAALSKLNFEKPTEIQNAVIPLALEGLDVMACAETGSGKTGAYAIPIVKKLIEDSKTNALVLAPTRELAQQIADVFRDLMMKCDRMSVATLVGGADMQKQIRALKIRPRVVVATPGRLADHLRRNTFKLTFTDILVLDEGDRMLDMGFAPQLNEILEYLPRKRQTSLFSATIPENVRKLASKYLKNPRSVDVGRTSLPVEAIKQSVIQISSKKKTDRLVDELNARQGSVIVFARTKRRTDVLFDDLKSYGIKVGLIHGGRSQGQRNMAIQQFKAGKTRVLCATDVAARGIDIPAVAHVINFDLPMMKEDYVHRIGRTARNGAQGEAVSFVTPEDSRTWRELAKKYKIPGVELQRMGNEPMKQESRPNRKRSRSEGPRRSRGSDMPSSRSNARPDSRSSFRPSHGPKFVSKRNPKPESRFSDDAASSGLKRRAPDADSVGTPVRANRAPKGSVKQRAKAVPNENRSNKPGYPKSGYVVGTPKKKRGPKVTDAKPPGFVGPRGKRPPTVTKKKFDDKNSAKS